MLLTLRKTGGFAGFQEVLGTVDSRTLGGEAQRVLAAQLKVLEQQPPAEPGADRFRYEVEVLETGRPSRVLTITDEGDPESPGMKALAVLGRILDLALI